VSLHNFYGFVCSAQGNVTVVSQSVCASHLPIIKSLMLCVMKQAVERLALHKPGKKQLHVLWLL
jgi:hypothetical protein